ncbi:hypothetical protein HWV62_3590 [Athelia sp. TMB]|nr:hypothetical protein HWV62_3590 [Athelia sp. TMB]
MSLEKELYRVDFHHHFFPSDLNKAKSNIDAGWKTPEGNLPWNPAISIQSMNALGIQIALLSLPANPSGEVSSENRRLARAHNMLAANICETYPGRFGFLAGLPFLDDIEGVLEEMAHSLDVLGADGIALTSSYGSGMLSTYIGHEKYDRIWEELDRREAVVFLHGAQIPSSTSHPDPLLGLPVVEVPNETFKAAAHLVVTGKKRKYPKVKIVLAHLGGSSPFLAARVAVLSRHMGCKLTPAEILEDFKTFYFETALSAHETNLAAMERFVTPDRILFGTDFPAVSTAMAAWYTENLDGYYLADALKKDAIMFQNAFNLLPGLRKRIKHGAR